MRQKSALIPLTRLSPGIRIKQMSFGSFLSVFVKSCEHSHSNCQVVVSFVWQFESHLPFSRFSTCRGEKNLKIYSQSLSTTFQFNVLFSVLPFVDLPNGRKLNLLRHNRPLQLRAAVHCHRAIYCSTMFLSEFTGSSRTRETLEKNKRDDLWFWELLSFVRLPL